MAKPKNDGKRLQDLVELVESKLKPAGYKVETNVIEFDSDGNLAGEFDIQFFGTNENTGFTWLIECRDRPSDGPANGGWIEQLYGRRDRFKFSKVTAVSSSGFALNAIKFAGEVGIELKEVKDMTAAEFSRWFRVEHMDLSEDTLQVKDMFFRFHAETMTPEVQTALKTAMAVVDVSELPKHRFIRCKSDGSAISVMDFFNWYAEVNKLKAQSVANEPARSIEFSLDLLSGGDSYEIESTLGWFRLHSIDIKGDIGLRTRALPIARASTYRDAETGKLISESVAFESHEHEGMLVTHEMHMIPETGLTHVVIRRKPLKKAKAIKRKRAVAGKRSKV